MPENNVMKPIRNLPFLQAWFIPRFLALGSPHYCRCISKMVEHQTKNLYATTASQPFVNYVPIKLCHMPSTGVNSTISAGNCNHFQLSKPI
jgi:hypothetical protein